MDPVALLVKLVADIKAASYGAALKDIAAIVTYISTFFPVPQTMHATQHATLDAAVAHLESLMVDMTALPWAKIFGTLMQILTLIGPFLNK